MGLGSLRLSPDAQAALVHYDWPGNVRELEHLIGRSASKHWATARHARALTLTAHDLDLPSTRVTEAAQPTHTPPQWPRQPATCAKRLSTTETSSAPAWNAINTTGPAPRVNWDWTGPIWGDWPSGWG